MLRALEEGVKGGVWFGLMDKVYARANLAAAFKKVKANRGAAEVDRMTIGGFELVRYADDFVVLCRTRAEAEAALAAIGEWMTEASLTLHPDKTRIADLAAGEFFDFPGYRFKHQEGKGIRRYPRPKSLDNLREKVREKTRRCSGHSLQTLIAQINPSVRGWFEYFKHSHRTVFPEVDGWVRMRLRSILRKRSKRPGRARGAGHQRWPNSFFVEQGLFCLTSAHARLRQSPCG